MSQTYRPLLRHWISRLGLPLALVAWAGYLAVYGLFFGSAILLIYAATIAFANQPPIWQREVRLDDQGLSARLGKETVRVLWSDVVAAWQAKHGRIPLLDLSSEEVTVGIPLEYFDSRAIWECVQRYVPPAALEADAYMRSPEYKVQMARAQSLLNDVREPLRVGYRPQGPLAASVVGIGLVAIGALLTLGSIESIFYFGVLLLMVGKLIVLITFYRVEMTSEAVTVIDWGKRHVVRWDEVEYIEHDNLWLRFVLYGRDKRLAVIGPQYLAGKDRAKMIEMLRAQIELRPIELRHRERALFTWSRNIAVGRPA